MNLRALLQTEFGQKILILIAPFILRPSDFKKTKSDSRTAKITVALGENLPFDESARFQKEDAQKQLVSSSLYLTPLAPAIGGVFLTGALVTCLRILHRAGLPVGWLLEMTSAELILKGTLSLIVFGYLYVFAREASAFLLRTLKISGAPDWPLAYWLTNIGGLYLLIGIMAWVITGLFSINLSFITGLIAFVVVIALGMLFRFEWRYQRENARIRLSPDVQRWWDGLTLVLLVLFAGVTLYFFASYLIPEKLRF